MLFDLYGLFSQQTLSTALVVGARWWGFFTLSGLFHKTHLPTPFVWLFSIAMTWALTPSVLLRMGSFEFQGILLLQEWAFGCFLGALSLVCFHALHFMGESMSYMMGLSNVVTQNQHTPSTVLASFLQQYGVVLFWASDMHHHGLRAFYRSYHVFPAGTFGLLSAHHTWAFDSLMTLASQTLYVALGCMAPFWFGQCAIQMTLGLMHRLMPSFPVFLISQPLEILIGFGVLWSCFQAFSTTLSFVFRMWL